MYVFYYVADQLKDEISFHSPPLRSFVASGSIYNDFDRSYLNPLETHSQQVFCYSQTTNFDDAEDSQEESLAQEAVDHAIIQEDMTVGMYDYVQWDTPLFDNFGNCNDKEYMQKVYKLSNELTFIKDCIEMFERGLHGKEQTLFTMRSWFGKDTNDHASIITPFT